VLFALAPLAVLVVEACPVTVNVLIKLDITDGERGEAGLDLLSDPVATYLEHDQKNEAEKHCPEGASPSFTVEDDSHLMIARQDSVRIGAWGQVIIGEELLAGHHPVPEDDEENWGCLQSVEYVLRKALVVHRWHAVAIVKHELLLEVQDDKGQAGDGEENWHAKTVHEGDEDDVKYG